MDKYNYYKNMPDGSFQKVTREDVGRELSFGAIEELERMAEYWAEEEGIGRMATLGYTITCHEECMGYVFFQQKADGVHMFSYNEAKMRMGWRDADALARRARYKFLESGHGLVQEGFWKVHYLNVGGLM